VAVSLGANQPDARETRATGEPRDPNAAPRPAPRLFLASRSPRRRELLAEHGYNFGFDHPGIEDSDLMPGQVSPAQWVASLAHLKAQAGRDLLNADAGGNAPTDFILGADTACLKNGQLIGTPRDAREAEAIIRSLMDGEHEVFTGVALVRRRDGKRWVFADRARVRLGSLSDEQVRAYIDSGQWQGKAGGYNLRERMVAGWPLSFQGDETTVMGLPMLALRRELAKIWHDREEHVP